MEKTLVLALILLGLWLAVGLAQGQPKAERPNTNVVILSQEKMTFRRISPRQYGTNAADFFLLESEVTNEMYQRYLKSMGKTKGDHELAEAERKRMNSRDDKWLLSTSPVYDLSNPSLLWTNNSPPPGLSNHPVALITIEDTKSFCQWLSQRYPVEGFFRLPTVQEWLIAAYGDKRNYPWGDEWSFDIPCVSISPDKQRSAPERVKTQAKDRTPEGIYDLWGNVAEYVLDPKDFPNETRWMGPSFKSYPLEGEKELFPFKPRNDWWGYAHSSELRSEDTGFRVLLEPNGHATD